MRTVDLTPEDRLDREIRDDDSQKGSDWHERTGQPFLRMGEVPNDLRPNHKKAWIYFDSNDSKCLPAAYAAEDNRRTVDQMMSFLGQTKYVQGHMGNQPTSEHPQKLSNKRK